MPIGQIITLGLGTPSSIPILTLTGLSPAITPPLPPGGGTIDPGLDYSVSTTMLAGVSYALPPRAISLDWLATGATIIYASVDGTHWTQIDITAAAGMRTIDLVCGIFIFASATVTVMCRKARAIL